MKKLLLIIIALSLGFVSCDDSSTDAEAFLTDYDKMLSQPGFQWIPLRKDQYEPKPEFVDSVKKYFDANIFDFYMFAKPSCTCEGSHNQIAYLFDIFDEAEISYDNCSVYAMNSINNTHPFEEILVINELPAFYVLRNGEVYYSIRDTLNKRLDNSKEATLEKILFEALKGE